MLLPETGNILRTNFILFLIAFFTLINVMESSAQAAEDSVTYLTHQIGFNATETISLFEEESAQNYKINYRYKLNESTALRSGINYRFDSSDTRALTLGIKAGMDKIFKRSSSWRFYAGADIVGGVEKLSNNARRNYQMGLAPFLGMLYYLGEHFSISTEPGLLVEVRRFNDRGSFNPDNSETWVEMKLVNVGQIVIGIHF